MNLLDISYKLDKMISHIDSMSRRLAYLENKIETMEKRIGASEMYKQIPIGNGFVPTRIPDLPYPHVYCGVSDGRAVFKEIGENAE